MLKVWKRLVYRLSSTSFNRIQSSLDTAAAFSCNLETLLLRIKLMKFISSGSVYLFLSRLWVCFFFYKPKKSCQINQTFFFLFCHGVALLCLKICKGRIVEGKKRVRKKCSCYFLVMLERTKMTCLVLGFYYNTELGSPFVPDHPATTTMGVFNFYPPKIFSFSKDF